MTRSETTVSCLFLCKVNEFCVGLFDDTVLNTIHDLPTSKTILYESTPLHCLPVWLLVNVISYYNSDTVTVVSHDIRLSFLMVKLIS